MSINSSSMRMLIAILVCLYVLPFLVLRQAEAGVVSTFNEEFNGSTLDPNWMIWDGYALKYPADITNHAIFAMTGSHLSISALGGVEHNMWWLEHAQATRIFEGSGVYEIKVDSSFDGDQQFGFVFESGPGTFMILMLYAHDKIWGYVERFSNVDGVQHRTTFPGCCIYGYDTGLIVPASGPYWLRVILKDDSFPANRHWKFEWSADGTLWNTIIDDVLEGTNSSSNIGVIQNVGIFAGNQPYSYSAFNARFDYYRTYPISALPVEGPSNLVATPGNQQISLSWDRVDDATEYSIYRSNTSGGPYTFLATATNTSYLDTGLVNGTLYAYVVAAHVNSIKSTDSNEAKAIPHVHEDSGTLPADGRLLVLSADTLRYVFLDNELITRWDDALGGPLAASVSQNNAPTFVTSAIAGRAAVRFDGVDDYLSLPAGFADFTDGLTLFIVARPAAVQAGSKLVLLGNGVSQANIALGRNGGGAGLQYFTTNSSGDYGWFGSDAALTTGEAALYTVTQGGGAANSTVTATIRKNGVEVGRGPVYVPPVATRVNNYLGRSYWSGDGYFQGELAEIILYNRTLNPAEQGAVHAHLAEKYELVLP